MGGFKMNDDCLKFFHFQLALLWTDTCFIDFTDTKVSFEALLVALLVSLYPD